MKKKHIIKIFMALVFLLLTVIGCEDPKTSEAEKIAEKTQAKIKVTPPFKEVSAEEIAKANSYFNSGYLKEIHDNFAEAIPYYDEAIKLNPKHANAYLNRGYARFNLGRYRDAIKDLNKAIELNPVLATKDVNANIAIKRAQRKLKE